MTNTLAHHENHTATILGGNMDTENETQPTSQDYLETGCVVSPDGEHDDSPEQGKCLNCDLPL